MGLYFSPHQAKSGTEIRLVREYRRLKRPATDDSFTGFTSDYAQVKDGQYIDMWGIRLWAERLLSLKIRLIQRLITVLYYRNA